MTTFGMAEMGTVAVVSCDEGGLDSEHILDDHGKRDRFGEEPPAGADTYWGFLETRECECVLDRNRLTCPFSRT